MDYITDKHLARARQDQLVIKEMPDEVLVYDLKTHQAHCLNKTAAFVWSHCDGQTTIAELSKLLSKELKITFEEGLVWRALDELNKADLLEITLERPKDVILQSRRRLLGKLGTAALLSVPIVMSITAPTAMAGASVCTLNTCQDKGSSVNDCGACLVGGILGTCLKSNGCGGGNVLGTNVSCSICFSTTMGGLNGKSWVCTSGC